MSYLWKAPLTFLVTILTIIIAIHVSHFLLKDIMPDHWHIPLILVSIASPFMGALIFAKN